MLVQMLIVVLAALLTAEVVRMGVRRLAGSSVAEFAGRAAGGFVAFCFLLHPSLGIRTEPFSSDVIVAAATVSVLGAGLTFLKDRYLGEWLRRSGTGPGAPPQETA